MKTFTKKTATGILGLFLAITANASITDALKVKVINGSTTDETVIRFLPSATTTFDGSYDAYKMFSASPTVPATFTRIDPVSPLSINALPALTAFTDVDLYIHVKVAGTYTLQASELGAFLPSTKIVLEDKQDGTFYYFKNGSSVTFPMTVNTVNSASRFVIHFRPVPTVATTASRYDIGTARAIGSEEESAEMKTPATMKASIEDGNLVMTVEAEVSSPATIMVYNINGQQLFSTSRTGSFTEQLSLQTSGTYIIYSVTDNVPHSQKISFIK